MLSDYPYLIFPSSTPIFLSEFLIKILCADLNDPMYCTCYLFSRFYHLKNMLEKMKCVKVSFLVTLHRPVTLKSVLRF